MIKDRVRTTAAAAATAGVLASLALTGQAGAATRSCHTIGSYQSVVATGVTCARAASVLNDLSTNISTRVHLGFRCTMGSKPNAKGLYPGTCKNGSRKVTYFVHPG
jgi:hypothetical protein